ncbi:hypothetical protein Patl1_06947 [Pistacia atlantica]|uniref:Uncharacterized protein n=1 Tax=Pistacia atlantica TaxID=434234 RepID=A0ACC1AG56_9ROSI|nr:hypothetical protein Patl1_06947 [Pistacia atlantica]
MYTTFRLVIAEWAMSLPLNHPVVLKKARAKLDYHVGPHESSDYCTIGGYDVPPSTMLIVNAWTIHRDAKLWEDPERRRSCPGAGLANRVMGLALATLIQCFEWERISEEEVDVTEGNGLTMPKVKPLEAMCKARERMLNVLSKL